MNDAYIYILQSIISIYIHICNNKPRSFKKNMDTNTQSSELAEKFALVAFCHLGFDSGPVVPSDLTMASQAVFR